MISCRLRRRNSGPTQWAVHACTIMPDRVIVERWASIDDKLLKLPGEALLAAVAGIQEDVVDSLAMDVSSLGFPLIPVPLGDS
jgi:hypothetical protein